LEDTTTIMVPSNPFGPVPTGQSQAQRSLSPASLEAAARVDSLGREILAANPQIGMRPMFRTIGAPQLEIFHVGTTEIHVTEGLVKECTTPGQLAAVLCQELGKMVSEREALAAPQARVPERPSPLEVRIGNDNAGAFGPADQLHRAEVAKYEKQQRERAAHKEPPAPQTLARIYLTKAGYPESDLDAAQPVLRAAAENRTFAKQMLAPTENWR
jgi:hypothetical protein